MIEVSETLAVMVNGEKRTLLMTFGLLNRLSATVNGMQDLADLGFGPETRVNVLTECFRRAGRNGFIEMEEDEKLDLDALEITREAAEEVLDWATQHLANFFMKRLKAAEKGMAQLTAAVQQVNGAASEQSPPGLKDSTSLTPSAGPSI